MPNRKAHLHARVFAAPGYELKVHNGLSGRRFLALSALLSLTALLAACGNDASQPGIESPGNPAETASPTEVPTPTPEATAGSRSPEAPQATVPAAPTPGPCPIQDEVCSVAQDLLAWARDADIGALMAATAPETYVCPAPGLDIGPVCDGVADGTTVEGFIFATGAHGPVLPAEDFRQALEPQIAFLQTAESQSVDNYATGELRIAAVACFRTAALDCSPEFYKVSMTYISNATDPAIAGTPGRKMICFNLRWPDGDSRPKISGFGCGVPPLHNLEAFEIPASLPDGVDGTLINYPWSP